MDEIKKENIKQEVFDLYDDYAHNCKTPALLISTSSTSVLLPIAVRAAFTDSELATSISTASTLVNPSAFNCSTACKPLFISRLPR